MKKTSKIKGLCFSILRKKLFLLIVLCILLMIGVCGCINEQKIIGENIKMSDNVSFNIMSQEEKREYVKQEFNTLYGIDCEISEIRKKQISMFENEKYYTGTASVSKNRWFPFWVNNFGNINDTYFCIELSDCINEHFSLVIDRYYRRSDYYLYCNAAFIAPPNRKWEYSDNIGDMYKSEDIENNIFLFLGRKNSDDMQKLEHIQEDLQCYKGRMKVYYCDNPDEIDFDSYDLNKHEYFFELE